jgi:hypothetical protein
MNSVSLHFQIHQKVHLDILDSLNKPKASGNCGFPLANPQKGPSIDFVPKSIIAN